MLLDCAIKFEEMLEMPAFTRVLDKAARLDYQ